MKKITVLVISILFTFNANAGYVTQGDLNITKIFAGYTGGEVYFLVDKLVQNPNGCAVTKSDYNVLAVDPSLSNASQVLSVLLTAKSSNSNVEIQVYNDRCFSNHAVIRRVAVY